MRVGRTLRKDNAPPPVVVLFLGKPGPVVAQNTERKCGNICRADPADEYATYDIWLSVIHLKIEQSRWRLSIETGHLSYRSYSDKFSLVYATNVLISACSRHKVSQNTLNL